MSNKQQTAVQWLVKNYLQKGKIDSFDIDQAKEMEKEQIIKFTNDYLDDDADLTAEQYYNETYGN
jgi:uncharacterized protein YbcC (UPF0753/DUF2309 family)